MTSFAPWRPHPWHGLSTGPDVPAVVNAFIEITPFDVIKYEVDKESGYLCVDRPQRGTSTPPVLYGFVPRTLCADEVARLTPDAHGGDGDPLDICVFSERPITRPEVIVRARVIGGFQTLDDHEADDKIVGVLESDPIWQHVTDIDDFPAVLLERLEHYLTTYKLVPGAASNFSVRSRYGARAAYGVVEAAMRDYQRAFGAPDAGGGDGR